MRKGWLVLALILASVVAVPAVVMRTGGGGWLKDKLLALHGRHGRASSHARAPAALGLDVRREDSGLFRITEVRADSPASDARLQPDDLITAIDGRAASEFTLDEVQEILARNVACKVAVRRNEKTMTVILTPR